MRTSGGMPLCARHWVRTIRPDVLLECQYRKTTLSSMTVLFSHSISAYRCHTASARSGACAASKWAAA